MYVFQFQNKFRQLSNRLLLVCSICWYVFMQCVEIHLIWKSLYLYSHSASIFIIMYTPEYSLRKSTSTFFTNISPPPPQAGSNDKGYWWLNLETLLATVNWYKLQFWREVLDLCMWNPGMLYIHYWRYKLLYLCW